MTKEHRLSHHIYFVQASAVVEVQLRLLVPATHIGCVIGRRGEMIRTIRDDTGAHIKVHEGSQGARAFPPFSILIYAQSLRFVSQCARAESHLPVSLGGTPSGTRRFPHRELLSLKGIIYWVLHKPYSFEDCHVPALLVKECRFALGLVCLDDAVQCCLPKHRATYKMEIPLVSPVLCLPMIRRCRSVQRRKGSTE